MAHVKVIRRSLLPDEWTRIRIGWLKKRLIASIGFLLVLMYFFQ